MDLSAGRSGVAMLRRREHHEALARLDSAEGDVPNMPFEIKNEFSARLHRMAALACQISADVRARA
jgi:hypothetical protein